jgi:hypothetical protein
MIDETDGQATGLSEIALKYIDGLADRAKTIVAIASPFVEEIAIAVRCFRGPAGAQPFDRREAPSEGRDFGSMSLSALGNQVKRHPLASLALVGALAATGCYIARRR